MFDRLAEAQRLVQEEFEDSRIRGGAAVLSDADLARGVEAAQRVINAAQAVQVQRVAQYAAREDVRLEDGTLAQQDRGVGHVSEFAAGVIGPRLGLSAAGADRKVGVSARLASRFAPTLGLMAAGELDEYRASVLVVELEDADPDVATAVQEVVLPGAPTRTAAQLRVAVGGRWPGWTRTPCASGSGAPGRSGVCGGAPGSRGSASGWRCCRTRRRRRAGRRLTSWLAGTAPMVMRAPWTRRGRTRWPTWCSAMRR